jgi:CDP-diacylglycerol--serine O-phosphatidyltransferase
VQGNFSRAGWLIFIAMLFDAFDGRVARLLKAESAFGVEMDSLADLVSFCVAPAMLIFYLSLQNIAVFGAPIAFMFVLCGAVRLARFNVVAHGGKSSKRYFSGLPTPAAAAILSSFAISYSVFALDSNGRIMPVMASYLPYIYNFIALITFVLAALMVSSIPYAAFKGGGNKKNRKFFLAKLVLIVFAIALTIIYPQDVVFIFFSSYAFIGIIIWILKAFRV